jgi:hypothetical protein
MMHCKRFKWIKREMWEKRGTSSDSCNKRQMKNSVAREGVALFFFILNSPANTIQVEHQTEKRTQCFSMEFKLEVSRRTSWLHVRELVWEIERTRQWRISWHFFPESETSIHFFLEFSLNAWLDYYLSIVELLELCIQFKRRKSEKGSKKRRKTFSLISLM